MGKIYTQLDNNGFAVSDGYVRCHTAWTSGEYSGESEEYCAKGQGLPAMAYPDAPPPEKAGFIRVRNVEKNAWEYVQDLRGKNSYRKADGVLFVVDYIGNLRPDFTLQAPATPYDKWNGYSWVTDTTAQHAAAVAEAEAKKTTLLDEANAITADWRTELALGIISEIDKTMLVKWMEYIRDVKAVDTSVAPDINWPSKPA
ncbi:tail fiber assembly protein [Edwardsiella tarda]|uniref:tail fiber assembly protein n=1 Tax=Edwardsiella tarda TaxID=636 RepID=UPI003A860E2B